MSSFIVIDSCVSICITEVFDYVLALNSAVNGSLLMEKHESLTHSPFSIS